MFLNLAESLISLVSRYHSASKVDSNDMLVHIYQASVWRFVWWTERYTGRTCEFRLIFSDHVSKFEENDQLSFFLRKAHMEKRTEKIVAIPKAKTSPISTARTLNPKGLRNIYGPTFPVI